MTFAARGPQWRHRLATIDSEIESITFPHADRGITQDHEWCEAVIAGRRRRFRFHDYADIYRVPGLYELLFYEHLKCCSPSRVVGLLREAMEDANEDPETLRVLDVGAGNGMVGDELAAAGAEHLVGIDIVPEAKLSTRRDRPGLYDDYLITDLTDLPERHEERLRRHHFNGLTCVAALGFGDIPAQAFLKALDMVAQDGWMAFNIKEDFLHETDTTGFCELVHELNRSRVTQIQALRRYRHRNNMNGAPLHYVAVVARKLRDLPDEIMEKWGL